MTTCQSLFDLYAVAKSKINHRQLSNIEKSDILENKVAMEMKQSNVSFCKYVGNITHLLSPIINEALNSKSDWGDIGIVKVKTSDSGLWQSQICIDASTSIGHAENECTYTVISMQKQVGIFSRKKRKKLYVLFVLNENEGVHVPLSQKCTFFLVGFI